MVDNIRGSQELCLVCAETVLTALRAAPPAVAHACRAVLAKCAQHLLFYYRAHQPRRHAALMTPGDTAHASIDTHLPVSMKPLDPNPHSCCQASCAHHLLLLRCYCSPSVRPRSAAWLVLAVPLGWRCVLAILLCPACAHGLNARLLDARFTTGSVSEGQQLSTCRGMVQGPVSALHGTALQRTGVNEHDGSTAYLTLWMSTRAVYCSWMPARWKCSNNIYAQPSRCTSRQRQMRQWCMPAGQSRRRASASIHCCAHQ